MALTGLRRRWRAFRLPENRGFRSPLLLAVLTVVFFVVGMILLPASGLPVQLPPSPTLDVTFQGPPPQQLSVLSFLKQTGSTELIVEASGQFRPGQAQVRWTVGADGFTGTNCTPRTQRISFVSLGDDNYNITAESPVRPFGTFFLTFQLCWQAHSPLVVSGSYLRANLPIVLSTVATGTVTRSLELSGTSLSDYSLVSGLSPTRVSLQSWTWSSSLAGDFGSLASTSIPVIGSSIAGIQSDNDHYLWAGIVFGVAGGAFVAIFPALLDAADRRKAAVAAARHDHAPDDTG